jgi:hypothetical protein
MKKQMFFNQYYVFTQIRCSTKMSWFVLFTRMNCPLNKSRHVLILKKLYIENWKKK